MLAWRFLGTLLLLVTAGRLAMAAAPAVPLETPQAGHPVLHWAARGTLHLASGATLRLPPHVRAVIGDEAGAYWADTHDEEPEDGLEAVLVRDDGIEAVLVARRDGFVDAGDWARADTPGLLLKLRRRAAAATAAPEGELSDQETAPMRVLAYSPAPKLDRAAGTLALAVAYLDDGVPMLEATRYVLGRAGYERIQSFGPVLDDPQAMLDAVARGFAQPAGQRWTDHRPDDDAAPYGVGALLYVDMALPIPRGAWPSK